MPARLASHPGRPGRRGVTTGLIATASLALAGFADGWHLDAQDLALRPGFGFGPLHFTLTDATTGAIVTSADFRGRVVIVYFGYTECPDICPLTMSNAMRVFHRLGPRAAALRFLFVTVDPMRDTLAILKTYTGVFGANVVGLRGTGAQLRGFAARLGARYSVHPSSDPEHYRVTHTSLAYVFNREGAPAFSIEGLSRPDADVAGIARDLAHLLSADQV